MIGRLLATLAVVVVCTACSASGDTAEEREDGPAVSGPESRDVLVHGRVLDGGKPVHDANVTIQIWPDGDLDDYAVGEAVDMFDVETSTDDDGRYVVRVDPRTLESRYFPGGDFVNFDVMVTTDRAMASWSTTAHLIGDRIWRSDPEARTGDRALELGFDLSKESVRTTTSSTGETTRQDMPVQVLDVAP